MGVPAAPPGGGRGPHPWAGQEPLRRHKNPASSCLRSADRGMSITEVLVAILVLGIFGAAATQLVIEATAVTVNNASRIQASALAQRELDFAAEIVSASVEGADSLLDPSRVVNPNVTPEVASGDPDFAFQVDGQRYRVERNARRQLLGSGSPCSNDTVVAVKQFALEVTVTVTWQGMGVATRPHVASKLFAPKRATAVGLANGESLLAVTISGAQPTVEP
ncbi:MAG: prepilin-type N-terminal cleavage/methylation domain-containing protein, partial [Bifidobacteriaceae bacterium]|nr:prepilin-type N-terminal cleavage/methylation domain-containing protein [Bifidobacteriaceae bacterium]